MALHPQIQRLAGWIVWTGCCGSIVFSATTAWPQSTPEAVSSPSASLDRDVLVTGAVNPGTANSDGIETDGTSPGAEQEDAKRPMNVLFIISDDLTATALSCYGSTDCATPNIDSLARSGTLFRNAYCQATYCGPSRASFLSGYYPHATGVLNYVSPRKAIGDRATWPQHFKNRGYHTARVSKIFHMGVPGGIEKGDDGADDPISWSERFNSQGPEWRAPGQGETLEGNPDGKRPVVGGNTFVVVAADAPDSVHSDSKTTAQACALIERFQSRQFFLAVGFVRPHVPFVAPKSYFSDYPFRSMRLPEKRAGDWDDIPVLGINYKTSKNMKMNPTQQRKAVAGYFASVAFMDAQVGRVLESLRENGLEDRTIVVFTSDHGYHLGEHDFWAKVSLHEESTRVPLIIRVPGKRPSVCNTYAELLDLYPTVSSLCGLPVPKNVQGRDISAALESPEFQVRDAAFCVNGKGFMLREQDFAYIQYKEDASKGIELFDMRADPQQFTNLAERPESQPHIVRFQRKLARKLAEIRNNDL